MAVPFSQVIFDFHASSAVQVTRDMTLAYTYRMSDLFLYSFMTLLTLLVWARLIHALWRYQYVYFLDHQRKISAQFLSLISFSALSLQYDF